MDRTMLAWVLLLAVACGGSGGPDAATFAREADARCAEANARLETVSWPTGDALSLASASTAIAQAGDVHRALAADLRRLAGDGAGRSVASAAERLVATYDELEASAARGDQPAFDAALTALVERGDAAAEASRDLGLRVCYRSEAAS